MQLETSRLILRDFKASDWQEAHEYACDPAVVVYMEWGPNSRQQTMDFVDEIIEKQRQKPRMWHEFAVIHKEAHKLIAGCGLRISPYDNEQADVGYCFHRQYWNQGYATEACRRVLQYGFETLQLHRIQATCDADNVGSARVLQKSGMRQEAHFRQDRKIKGRWRDSLLFAVLNEEWRSAQQ